MSCVEDVDNRTWQRGTACYTSRIPDNGARREVPMHLVSYSDIRDHVTLASTYAPVRASFKAYSDGTANIPPVQHLEMPYAENGALHIKSGHVRGHALCIVKVASTFPSNPTRNPPLPSIGGLIVLFDLETGSPVAVLEDR